MQVQASHPPRFSEGAYSGDVQLLTKSSLHPQQKSPPLQKRKSGAPSVLVLLKSQAGWPTFCCCAGLMVKKEKLYAALKTLPRTKQLAFALLAFERMLPVLPLLDVLSPQCFTGKLASS